MRKNIKKLICILIIAIEIISLLPMALLADTPVYNITLNELSSPVAIHTELQTNGIYDSMKNVTNYAKGNAEFSRPLNITLSFESNVSGNVTYIVKLSKNENMTDSKIYESTTKSISVTNLEIGTTYYWQVSFTKDNQTCYSEISSFITENITPRNLNIDGVANVRDLGGITTMDGKVIKQGRFYRCGKFNENNSTTIKITKAGIEEFVNNIGIKSEIDLRRFADGENGSITTSFLGESVTYYNCPMDYEGNNYLDEAKYEDNIASVKKAFEIFADEDNYPIAFHCSIGTDRTGIIAYLLEGLLGVSEANIIKDYLFSNFALINNSTRTANYLQKRHPRTLKNVSGSTFREKIYNYLHDTVGVSTEDLDKIIEMSLEDPKSTTSYTEITSEAEFLAMDPYGNYRLTSDISITSSYTESFYGILDCNNHTINTTVPIFNTLYGNIKNLNITGSISSSDSEAGALAKTGHNCVCEYITNESDIKGQNTNTGGIVGKSLGTANYLNCINYGNIESENNAGGIIGFAEGDITLYNCENHGEIKYTGTSSSYYSAGVVARCEGYSFMEGCINYGDVSGYGKYTAGIIAYIKMSDSSIGLFETFIGCKNYGKITRLSGGSGTECYVAGIVARAVDGDYYYNSVCNCENYGKLICLEDKTTIIAGICAKVSSTKLLLTDCLEDSVIKYKSSSTTCKAIDNNSKTADTKYYHDNSSITLTDNGENLNIQTNYPSDNNQLYVALYKNNQLFNMKTKTVSATDSMLLDFEYPESSYKLVAMVISKAFIPLTKSINY